MTHPPDLAVDAVLDFHRLAAQTNTGPARTAPPAPRATYPAATPSWRTPTTRVFADRRPPEACLTRILTHAYGYAEPARAVPSAGRTYGLRIHLVGYDGGPLSRFHPDGRLETVRQVSADAVRRCLHQQFAGTPWIVVVSGTLPAYTKRYEVRGYRYLLLEAGHLVQEMIHAASGRFVCCPFGSFDDQGLLHLTAERFTGAVPVYGLAVGERHDRTERPDEH